MALDREGLLRAGTGAVWTVPVGGDEVCVRVPSAGRSAWFSGSVADGDDIDTLAKWATCVLCDPDGMYLFGFDEWSALLDCSVDVLLAIHKGTWDRCNLKDDDEGNSSTGQSTKSQQSLDCTQAALQQASCLSGPCSTCS